MVAEFDDPNALVDAGRELHHEHGFKKLDAMSPFPVHGIDDAIGTPKSILGYVVAGCALFGLLNAIFMIWYIGGGRLSPGDRRQAAVRLGILGAGDRSS